MRHSHYTVSARSVTDLATQLIATALAWTSPRVDPLVLVQLLVRAAAQTRSLTAVVLAVDLPHSLETIRRTLLRLLPDKPLAFQPTINRLLHQRLPATLRDKPLTLAVDIHHRPYYGRSSTPGTYRGPMKAGTRTSFAYATLIVLPPGPTYTIALTPVARGEDGATVVDRLLAQAREAGLTPHCLLLDRGFYGAKVIRLLQDRSIPFVMPMIRRGRKGRRKADCTGTQPFFVRGRRGWDRHTWTVASSRNGKKGSFTVTIDVCMVSASLARQGKRRQLAYACHGQGKADPHAIVALYRRRFGIETSYRQLGEGLAMTCSRQATYRLLLVVLAVVLRNVWVWVHAEQLCAVGPDGARRLCLNKLRLRTIMAWLVAELDTRLTTRARVASGGEPPSNGE